MKHLFILISLICLFSSTFAIQTNKDNSANIIQSMSAIEPFLKLNSDKTVQFDYFSAKQTLDNQTLEFGQRYERFHNSIISELASGKKAFQTKQDQEDLAIFEPFFQAVQKSGALTTKDLLISSQIESNYSTVPKGSLKLEKQSNLSFSPLNKIQTISFTCNGGSMINPAYCPAWQYPTNQYSSLSAASTALKQMGWHNTYAPGCDTLGNPCNIDFTLWLTTNGCNLGVFRNQAIPYQSGSKWKVKFQTPEPNPEIFSYTWPAAVWWGPYVAWWHQLWIQPNGKVGC